MDKREMESRLHSAECFEEGMRSRAKEQGIYFCGGAVKLPDHVFVLVLNFLSRREQIDQTSFISKVWAKATHSPLIEHWLTMALLPSADHGRARVQHLLSALSRRQFKMLKTIRWLGPKGLHALASHPRELARNCPNLEKLEFLVDSTDIVEFPHIFSKLTSASLRFDVRQDEEDSIAYSDFCS